MQPSAVWLQRQSAAAQQALPRDSASPLTAEVAGDAGRLDVVVVVMSFLDLVLAGIPDWLVRAGPEEGKPGVEGGGGAEKFVCVGRCG